ncbi:MAG: membrane dipeptidase, partial [Acidobacteria bacterium]|nr:membrane dipeptidase [Acidobacteriota bacterium]
ALDRRDVGLELLVEHIDHICQLAGNARHCGIGSDLDGGRCRPQQGPDGIRPAAAAAPRYGICLQCG